MGGASLQRGRKSSGPRRQRHLSARPLHGRQRLPRRPRLCARRGLRPRRIQRALLHDAGISRRHLRLLRRPDFEQHAGVSLQHRARVLRHAQRRGRDGAGRERDDEYYRRAKHLTHSEPADSERGQQHRHPRVEFDRRRDLSPRKLRGPAGLDHERHEHRFTRHHHAVHRVAPDQVQGSEQP